MSQPGVSRDRSPWAQLPTSDRIALALLTLGFLVYLPIVVQRVTVHGFGDTQVFFRAGWAIWTGYPLYEVADHHGWTYHYPPTFALAMGPFALPLPGIARPVWALPLWASTAVWYIVCAAALIASAHVWARMLEREGDFAFGPRFGRAWWLLRAVPLFALAPFGLDSLGRGQPTAIILLCMILFLDLYVRGRIAAAAFALAVGITIKLFPGLLALIPLLRRDWKCLLWVSVWCAALLFLVPVIAVGPAATFELYRTLWLDRIGAILSGTPNAKLAGQVSFWSYDMGSIGAMLARIVHGRTGVGSELLPAWASRVQLGADAVLLALLVWAGHRRFWSRSNPQPAGTYPQLVAGAIIMAMLPLMLPTSQPNYWAQAMPLVGVILVACWRSDGVSLAPPRLLAWAALTWFGMIATEARLWEPLRLLGLVTPMMLILTLWGVSLLSQEPRGAHASR